jgi:GH18 family chitinase
MGGARILQQHNEICANKKNIMLNVWFIHLEFTPQVQTSSPATPQTQARLNQMMKTKKKIEKKNKVAPNLGGWAHSNRLLLHD